MNDYVNYGAGLSCPDGWLNFDASPTLRLQLLPGIGRVVSRFGPGFPSNLKFGDITRGLPVDPGSCSGVYCSHALEHLSLEDMRKALRNTYAMLRPGGVFRLVVPDLLELAQSYVGDSREDASLRFVRNTLLGSESRPAGLLGHVRAGLGNSSHLWMWDANSMSAELREVGFQDIRLAAVGDSGDPMFDTVEDPDRFLGAFALHCTKSNEEPRNR
jgi:SAM-dependent methyltransferase